MNRYTDKEILEWLYLRLIYQYKENPNYDYMRRFRAVIETIPQDQRTENLWYTSPEQLYSDDWREIESSIVERFKSA